MNHQKPAASVPHFIGQKRNLDQINGGGPNKFKRIRQAGQGKQTDIGVADSNFF